MPSSEAPRARQTEGARPTEATQGTRGSRLIGYARGALHDREASVDLRALVAMTCLAPAALADRSVLLATRTQLASAVAMIELDGLVGRMVLTPPGLKPEHFQTIIEDAAVDTIVTDAPQMFAEFGLPIVPISLPLQGRSGTLHDASGDTEWVMLTSGTSGRPKLVVHTLAALTGAVSIVPPGDAPKVWATFYDIRRYGGLQIFLRALLGGCDLVLSSDGEPLADHMRRLARDGVTSMSGTPSHWRRVLMSGERGDFAPAYVRLSGEIADQAVLDGLRAAFPKAAVGHAYASTEAGVGFAVEDGREGFPAVLVDQPSERLTMKVEDGSLRIRSARAASRYLGAAPPMLADTDGFVDTGDLVERRADRYHFVGRRGGIINVGGLKVNPEEVEAALNAHRAVRLSLVKARKSPLTGAIVVAEIVLRDPDAASEALKTEIVEACRDRLDRHKVPALVRFVTSLPLTTAGKLSREG